MLFEIKYDFCLVFEGPSKSDFSLNILIFGSKKDKTKMLQTGDTQSLNVCGE